MPNPQNITKIPSSRVALIDPNTGLISREWFRFFNNIFVISGGSTLGVAQIENGGTGGSTAAEARANIGAGTGSGTVTEVMGSGSVNGLTLTGTVTTSGAISLGGALSNVDLASQVVNVLPTANGGTGAAVSTIATRTVDFTVAYTDAWIINNKSGSTCTVTLPDATFCGGRQITFKNLQAQALVSASSNVAPINSATLGTSILPATVGAWATLVSNGTNWVIMAS